MKIYNVLIAIDELVNTAFGGWPGETISGRTWRLRANQPYAAMRPFIDWIFSYWGQNHCQSAFDNRNGYVPPTLDTKD